MRSFFFSDGVTSLRMSVIKAAARVGLDAVEDEEDESDDLSNHWYDLRQYLDCTWRLCTSLETDRRMSELRCRAQIDIVSTSLVPVSENPSIERAC